MEDIVLVVELDLVGISLVEDFRLMVDTTLVGIDLVVDTILMDIDYLGVLLP